MFSAEDQEGFFITISGAVGGVGDTKSILISCNWWRGLSLWDTCDDCPEQSWKPLFDQWILPSCPSLPWGNCELFAFHCSHKIAQRTEYRLLLPEFLIGGDDVAPLQIFRWAIREKVDERQRNWSVQGCVRVHRAGTAAAVLVVHEEPPWRRGDILCFCSAQVTFRDRQHLYKVCIVTNHEWRISVVYVDLLFLRKRIYDVSGVSISSTCGPWACNP